MARRLAFQLVDVGPLDEEAERASEGSTVMRAGKVWIARASARSIGCRTWRIEVFPTGHLMGRSEALSGRHGEAVTDRHVAKC